MRTSGRKIVACPSVMINKLTIIYDFRGVGLYTCFIQAVRDVKILKVLPVCDVAVAAAAAVVTGLGLLIAAAGFFRTTRDPSAPRPPSVPTLLSQLSTLALFTPPDEVPYGKAHHETIHYFLLTEFFVC